MTEPLSSHETTTVAQVGDSFDLLLAQKPLLFASVVLFGLVGAAYTVLIPPRYEVRTTILLPGTKAMSGAAGLAQSLGVAGLAGGGDTTLPMFRKILESETVTSAVSSHCGVSKKDLRKIRSIDDDAKTNTIDVSVQNNDQALGMKIANEFLAQLTKENAKLSLPGKSRKADLLFSTLSANNRALDEAEKRLKSFVSNALTSPGMPGTSLPANEGGAGSASTSAATSSAVATGAPVFRYRDQLTTLSVELDKLNSRLTVIDAKSVEAGRVEPSDYPPVAEWREKMTDLAAKLSVARASYSENSAEVQEAKTQYEGVKKLMQQDVAKYLAAVEKRVTTSSAQLDQDRAAITRQISTIRRLADAAPQEALEYQRLVRDVATLSSLVSQFRIQYEQAKLESADDPNRWEILDRPMVEEEPVNKKYSRNISIAALLGFFLTVPLALRRAKGRSE